MATQIPPQHPDTPLEPATTPQRTSPVLVGALAVALVALGIWWSQQRDAEPLAPMTTGSAQEAADPATPAVAADTTGRMDKRVATDTRPATRASTIADRAARPLAANPAPSYPRDALRSGSEGRVVVSISVGADGVPTDVSVTERSGDRSLDRAALQAARQWRFEPAMRDGKAVASTVRLPVDFTSG